MGLIDSLNIAVRAMQVEQNSIRTTSHNIANVDTPGYSRQQVERTAGSPSEHEAGNLGTGVEQVTVRRVNDAVLDRQILVERSSLASADTQAGGLSQVEEIFNEQTGAGVGSALSAFYASFSDLANNPSGSTERQAVILAADSVLDKLHSADRQLRSLGRDANSAIGTTLEEINGLARRIADLNVSIAHAEVRAPANDLRDQRDEVLRELADRIDVSAVEQNDGQLYVFVDGGLGIVQGELVNKLETAADPTNPFDSGYVRVFFTGSGNSLDVTDSVGGGRLGGLLAVRDSITSDAVRELDTIAYNLASQVNGVHAAGTGLDGSVGNFFTLPAQVEDAATSVMVEASIRTNLDSIAAGQSTAPGDNRNALDLAALRDMPAALFLLGDPPGPASGPVRSLTDQYAALGADIGQRAAAMQSAELQGTRVLESIENRRDELSGVSIDEEVSDLVRLQAAFQANARVVNTVRELLEEMMALI